MRAARVLAAVIVCAALVVMAGASVVSAQANRRRACYERHLAFQGYFGNIETYRPYIEKVTGGPTAATAPTSRQVAEEVWPGGC